MFAGDDGRNLHVRQHFELIHKLEQVLGLGHGNGELFAGFPVRNEFVTRHQIHGHQLGQFFRDNPVQLDIPVGELGRHDLGEIFLVDQALLEAQLSDHLLGNVFLRQDILQVFLGHEAELQGPVAEAKLAVGFRWHCFPC